MKKQIRKKSIQSFRIKTTFIKNNLCSIPSIFLGIPISKAGALSSCFAKVPKYNLASHRMNDIFFLLVK